MEKIPVVACYIMILFLVSCSVNDPGKKEYATINIDNSQVKPEKDISAHIHSINVLPLIETKDNHVGGIYKLLITPNNYIVYDRLITNKLLLFSRAGKFIKTIIKVGDGPSDPLNIIDCWLNEHKELQVYDYAQMKVFTFDSLFVLKGTKTSRIFTHFAGLISQTGRSHYVGYGNYSDFNPPFQTQLYQIAFLDSNLKVFWTDKAFERELQGITWPMYKRHFYNYKDTVRFVKAYDNYVYSIVRNNVVKRFRILYKDNNLPDDVTGIIKAHLGVFKDRSIGPNIKANYFKMFTRFNGLWLENDKYIFMSSRDTSGKFGESFYSLINRAKGEELFSTKKMVETVNYKLVLPPFEFYDHDNDEFISVVDGHTLKKSLFPESSLQSILLADLNVYYIIKVKLK